jgi:hypothetical protein
MLSAVTVKKERIAEKKAAKKLMSFLSSGKDDESSNRPDGYAARIHEIVNALTVDASRQ